MKPIPAHKFNLSTAAKIAARAELSETTEPMVLTLPYLLPGLNGDNGLIRMHWAKRKELSDYVEFDIQRQAKGKFVSPVWVAYYRYYSGRAMDWDNAAASFKLVGDAIVSEIGRAHV